MGAKGVLQEQRVVDPCLACRLSFSKPSPRPCVVLKLPGLDDARCGESRGGCVDLFGAMKRPVA